MSAFVPSSAFTGVPVRGAVAHRTAVPSPASAPARHTVVAPTRRCAPPAVRRVAPRASVTLDLLTNRSFQLEEDEDSLSCTSAVYLQADGHLTIGRTDGPCPDKVDATWKFNDSDGELVLDIQRFFNSDSGNVPFCVRRILRGHIDPTLKKPMADDLPAFTGAMYQYPADYSKHSEVGWFAMILAVDDLPTADYDISASQ